MLKNITLSADEQCIRLARQRAMREHKTLNTLFREWLACYAGKKGSKNSYQNLMKSLSYANSGKRFSRDELNER